MAFDVDGVVADTMDLFVRIARERYGVRNIRVEDITSYELSECLAMDPGIIGAIVEELIHGTHAEPLCPMAGAARVLKEISGAGLPLVFVTARPRQGPIRDWLLSALDLAPGAMEVVATGSYDAKAGILREAGRTWFVEDRLETCFNLHESGIRPVVFAQPWNRRPHPFPEVNSWEELRGLLEGL